MNMSYFLRRLFVVFVCLSVLFLNTFSAFASTNIYEGETFGQDYEDISLYANNEDTTKGDFLVRYNFGIGKTENGQWTHKKFYASHSIYDNQMQGYENSITFARNDVDFGSVFNYSWSDQFVIERADKTKIGSKGQSLTFSIKNFSQHLQAFDSNGNKVRDSYFVPTSMYNLFMYVYGQDGTGIELLNLSTTDISKYVTVSNGLITIGGELSELPIDVYKVNVFITYAGMGSFNNNAADTSMSSTSWSYPTLTKVWGYDESSSVVLKVEDNTSGLLSSIIGFISSILDGVTQIFSKIGDFMTAVANSFTELFSKLGGWFENLVGKISSFMSSVGSWFSTLFQHIIDLPSKVWTVFENGLKAVFVPDEEFIQQYKDNWDTLLEDRFGCIYQAVEEITNFVQKFKVSSVTETITIPSTTIEFKDGTSFTFGGYRVAIIPSGFGFLVTLCKSITDIICTLAVLNTLKNKYERLVGA